MGMFGDPVAVAGMPPASADHTIMVPHRHNGPQSEPRPSGITPCTTGVDREPRPSRITFPSTCLPHNGRAYHTGTTSTQHNERSYHTLHNGLRHDGNGTTRLQEARFTTSKTKKNDTHAATGAERVAA